jgi:hypothetical protein
MHPLIQHVWLLAYQVHVSYSIIHVLLVFIFDRQTKQAMRLAQQRADRVLLYLYR